MGHTAVTVSLPLPTASYMKSALQFVSGYTGLGNRVVADVFPGGLLVFGNTDHTHTVKRCHSRSFHYKPDLCIFCDFFAKNTLSIFYFSFV